MNYVKLNKYPGNSTRVQINGIPYITFPVLEKIDWIRHGFSTKLGGISTEHLSSLNLGFSRGDKMEKVVTNHEIIAKAIGFDAQNIVVSDQTHTTSVRVVSKADRGKGIYTNKDYTDIDGFITNEKNVVLATYFADCVPLYIVDIKNHAIGLSHSGWKGTVGKIGHKTLMKMSETYGTDPKDVIVCIGPSICQNCYEISKDVALQFVNNFPEHKEDILIEKPNQKYHLNLWKCNQLVFLESGVLFENIHITDICTCCNIDTLYSHRGHYGMRGNLAAFLEII